MEKTHTPYETILHRTCDFRVAYEFYELSRIGKKTTPPQGIRCNFWYEHHDHNHKKNWAFILEVLKANTPSLSLSHSGSIVTGFAMGTFSTYKVI